MTETQRLQRSLEAATYPALESAYLRALTLQVKNQLDTAAWAEFRRLLVRSFVLSNLIGRLSVMNRLAAGGTTFPVAERSFGKDDVKDYAETSIITAPFTTALNMFVNRVPMMRKVVDKLLPEAKARAFWVTGVESREALDRIQTRLTQPLTGAAPAKGTEGGLRGFIADEEELTNLTRARLETVFRTNTMSALNEGAMEQVKEPMVRAAIALLMLEEIQDRRTRGNPSGLYPDPDHPHFQMDEFIERPDHEVWKIITPPNGYNCRAHVSVISWRLAEDKGWAKDGKLDQAAIDRHNGNRWELIRSGRYPDEGFKGPKL
jgi:hypothetical protein